MKHLLASGLALLALGAAAEPSTVPSHYLSGEAVYAMSPNGEWIISEMSGELSMAIRNLKTGKAWGYIHNGTDFGDSWDLPITRGVANDGTVVGEYNNVPSYWRNGKWTSLKGITRDSNGTVIAIVGAITPDGSTIVGSIGKGKGMYDDAQMTYPCLWYRNEDGTYGEPVWLPNPDKDIFGNAPQYVNATSISNDGKTIGVLMRSGQGFHHIPYVIRQDENGEWSYQLLGMELLNPTNMNIPKFPGEYWGPDMPNVEDYMTDDQIAQFYSEGDKWIDELYAQGITDETEITYLELEFAMQFMSEDKRAIYEPLMRAFLDQYPAWQKSFDEWNGFLERFDSQACDFLYNKVQVSPDGRYVYAAATGRGGSGGVGPVRFDMKTGETTQFTRTRSVFPTCITDDYSVLCKDYNSNDGIAYIYPANSTRPVSFLDYWRDNTPLYNWLEEHMYVQVVTGVTSTGNYQLGDQWCMGRPVAAADLSIFGFGCSTEYWYPEPADGTFVGTFIVNPDVLEGDPIQEQPEIEDSAVDQVTTAAEMTVSPRSNSMIEVSGNVAAVEVYDLSGALVYKAANPQGTLSTGLASGVYVVKAASTEGKTVSEKALF